MLPSVPSAAIAPPDESGMNSVGRSNFRSPSVNDSARPMWFCTSPPTPRPYATSVRGWDASRFSCFTTPGVIATAIPEPESITNRPVIGAWPATDNAPST